MMQIRSSALRFLRRFRLWDVPQDVARSASSRLALGLHRALRGIDPAYLPVDLVLKHHYDSTPATLDPQKVTSSISVRAGIEKRRSQETGILNWLKIERELGGGWKCVTQHISRNLHGVFVVGGDWDLKAKPFKPLPSVDQLMQGGDPRMTDEYHRLLRNIEARDFLWTRGMRSGSDLDAYFGSLIELIEDIRVHGYRSQASLGNRHTDEIRVCVDRAGRFHVFGGGTHRLSIAQLLEIPEVPVVVKRVHANWVSQCVDRFGGPAAKAVARGLEDLGVRLS